jgi:hypothetical protein
MTCGTGTSQKTAAGYAKFHLFLTYETNTSTLAATISGTAKPKKDGGKIRARFRNHSLSNSKHAKAIWTYLFIAVHGRNAFLWFFMKMVCFFNACTPSETPICYPMTCGLGTSQAAAENGLFNSSSEAAADAYAANLINSCFLCSVSKFISK